MLFSEKSSQRKDPKHTQMDGVRRPIFVLSAVIIVLFVMYQCIPATNKYRTILQEQQQSTEDDDNEAKHQFITHGRWMPGRKHNLACEFITKAYLCCKKEQNLHFEFYNKRLNKVDAVKEFRTKLRNKKILLMGDSLMIEFYNGLVALLQRKNTSKYYSTQTDRVLTSKKCGKTLVNVFRELVIPANNSTVTMLTAKSIWLESERNFSVRSNFSPTPEKLVRRQISNHDIIFINQGLHYFYVRLHGTKEDYFYRIGQMLYGKDFMAVLHNKYTSRIFATYHSISVTFTSQVIKNLATKITQTSTFQIFGNFHIGLNITSNYHRIWPPN